MNVNARKWVEALRSGKYKQSKGSLCKIRAGKVEGYCCLGVGAKICSKTKNILIRKISNDLSFDHNRNYLSPIIQRWLGLKTRDGALHETSLAKMNDSDSSFLEIADIIEAHEKELFVEES